MLYGFREENRFYVVAGDDKEDYDAFVAKAQQDSIGGREAEVLDILITPCLTDMRGAWIVEDSDVGKVTETFNIEVVTQPQALSLQMKMFNKLAIDPYSSEGQADDGRSLEEIFGLEKNDPWDKRSPEQIARDEKMRALGEQAKKENRLSGDSFAPKKDKGARLTDVKVTHDQSGKIKIDSALGVKGLYDGMIEAADKVRAEKEAAKAARQGTGQPEEPDEDTDTKRPWDTDEDTRPMSFKDLRPDEFLFSISSTDIFGNGSKTTLAIFAPKVWFDREKTLFDGGMKLFIGQILPSSVFDMVADSVFVVNDMTPDETRATLLKGGFGEDVEFNTFLDQHSSGAMLDISVPADMTLARDLSAIDIPEISEEEEQELIDGVQQIGHHVEEKIPEILFEVPDMVVVDQLLAAFGREPGEINRISPTSFTTPDQMMAGQLGISLDIRKVPAKLTIDGNPFDYKALIKASQMVLGLPFSIFFRVDFPGMRIEEVIDDLEKEFIIPKSVLARRGELSSGSWAICGIERIANKVTAAIAVHHPKVKTEIYGVGPDGERLVASGQGAKVIDPNAVVHVIGPRRWNAEHADIKKMTPEARKVNEKSIKGQEFYFNGSEERAGLTHIFIVPKTYFDSHDHDELFPRSLKIDHLLPADFTEVSPGRYKTGRDYNTASYELSRRGFVESVLLRVYLNQF